MRKTWVLALLLFVNCGHRNPTAPTDTTPRPGTIALVNGTLIDGTGADPIANAVVVIDSGRIAAAGPRTTVAAPAQANVVDVRGGSILPGFINAHVHDAFDAGHLQPWAQAGVTTVRDMEILSTTPGLLESCAAMHTGSLRTAQNARPVMAGYILTVPGGYGRSYVSTPEEARDRVLQEVALGIEVIKYSLETGYGNLRNLPLLSPEQVAAIVSTAHANGRRVTAHVTQARFLRQIVDAGADEAAHMPSDPIADDVVRRMVSRGFIIVPTMTVMEAYGVLAGTSDNLGRFVAAGGQVAMGNDYATNPTGGIGTFELGMPIHELMLMSGAGMSPMQIIVASTRNAARACGLDGELGTIQAGKAADLLVVDGDPLFDLTALTRPRVVVHDGVVIRSTLPPF